MTIHIGRSRIQMPPKPSTLPALHIPIAQGFVQSPGGARDTFRGNYVTDDAVCSWDFFTLIFCLHIFRAYVKPELSCIGLNLVGTCPFSRSRLFLKRPPHQDTTMATVFSLLVGPLTAAAFIFLAACGCWKNRCQECGSWEFIPTLREPLTSGRK